MKKLRIIKIHSIVFIVPIPQYDDVPPSAVTVLEDNIHINNEEKIVI